MNFFNNIRDFLGFSKPEFPLEDPKRSDDSQRKQFFSQTPSDFYGHNNEDEAIHFDDQSPRQFTPRGFSVFSDPLEMHRYFEHQMNEMLKSFGFHQFDDDNSAFHSFSIPSIEGQLIEEEPQSTDEIRDQYLKPGYEKPTHHGNKANKIDKDVDGKLNMGDLDSIFGGRDKQLAPFESRPSIRMFGQSVTTKTIRHSDGSIETHRTVKDNEGNEETTVTKRLGEKEYTITKRRNKNGEEESIENLVNIDENDIDKIFKGPKHESLSDADVKPHNWFPFDKFFK